MSIASGLLTYGDVSRRESVVLDSVELLTAEENKLLTMLGKTTAIDTVHSYLTDTLVAAASKAVAMNTDFALSALTTPSRLTNIVQEVAEAIQVSRPQEVVLHYHGENEAQRQTTKALKNWGNAVEFDLVRSSLVSGLSGTTAKMAKLYLSFRIYYNNSIWKRYVLHVTRIFSQSVENFARSNVTVYGNRRMVSTLI